MTTQASVRRQHVGVIGLIAFVVAACSAGGPGTTSVPTDTAPPAADAFAGLPFRLALPKTWIVQGSAAYDTAIDAGPDVVAWLKGLDLEGQNAFRAYEPLADAAGLRLAINPLLTWNPSPLQDEGAIAALAGVTGKVSSDVLATGATWKAFGYRWTQEIDWGDGSPSARTCIGYFVMAEFNPVNVVFSYPAGTDRQAEVEAIVTTFEVLGNPVVSLPPGVTPAPSPTPYDKYGSPEPMPTFHSDPSLEALLPDSVDGRTVTKESRTGVDMGMTDTDPMLKPFGKHPADMATGSGTAKPTETRAALLVGVTRLRGVPADQLMAVQLEQMPDAKVSTVSLGGREVTYVEYGAWPVWLYPTGELLYAVGLADEATATKIFAALP
jgi:hypothetical protein